MTTPRTTAAVGSFRTTGLQLAAWLLLALFVLPMVIGLGGTILPAMGLLPSLAPGNGLMQLLADPRLLPALLLSIATGVSATVLVFLMTVTALVCLYGRPAYTWLHALLPPILAVPHAAMAVGLAFLIAPSGALVRLVSPELTGWERPPTGWVVPDAQGLTLMLGLVIKETPFLLLAAMAQLPLLQADQSLRIGRTLGYTTARCWSRLILPRLYPRIRPALMIILAYNLTVVDMAIVLGPGNPPTLSVLLISLINDPGSRAAASAGALLLGLLVAALFLLASLMERLLATGSIRIRRNGARGITRTWPGRLGRLSILLLMLLGMASLLVLLIWSLAHRWRFPDAWPSEWTLLNWLAQADTLRQPALTTVAIALCATLLALIAAIAWLEAERSSLLPRLDGLWYLPLLIPQVSLLFGWQAFTLWSGLDGFFPAVVFAHWLYVLPYVLLMLAVAWRELPTQWAQAAGVLGAGYWRILWQVRLPLLRQAVWQAAAVAMAVSVAQYLPTLLTGAGRYPTLTTELVTSAGGVDRRVTATLAVLQGILPLLAFMLAVLYPRWQQRRLAGRARAGDQGVMAN